MIDLFDDAQIVEARTACRHELVLTFYGFTMRLMADCPSILAYLTSYYAGLTAAGRADRQEDGAAPPELRLWLLNQRVAVAGREWIPVKQARPRAQSLKEAYVDTPTGRWIHKVRTGMALFQSLTDPMAAGDLMEHPSQVINFINNQFLNYHQRSGYLLGHASAFDIDGSTTAVAASSGGGKSTLMLKALETPGARFLSNDRILFKPDNGRVDVIGVAKHPRVNPGTLVHSARLINLLPAEERERFINMPQHQLWDIEQKYDVRIPNAYGEGKTVLSGTLNRLILLDWSLDATAPTDLSRVDIAETPEALEGLRKSPGAFFQHADGRFPARHAPSADRYAEHLPGVDVLRLTGAVDFERAIALLKARGIL